MSGDKPSVWSIGRDRRGEAGSPLASMMPPPPKKPAIARISVVQPQRNPGAVHRSRGVGTAADRDSRLGRRLVLCVAGGAILLFGSNFAGLWETPGQRDARIEAAGKSRLTKALDERERSAMARREADRLETLRIANEREAQRKAAYEEAVRSPSDQAVGKKSVRDGKSAVSAAPNLADTECQTTKPIETIVASCSRIISRFKDFADAYYVRGWALRERNQPERALTDFNRALELAPNRAATHSQRGLTYVRLKDFDRAIVDYNMSIELDPKSAAYVNDRGVAYMDLKDYARAIADFDQAVRLDRHYALPYNNRARAYVLSSSDHVRAIADLDRAIEINPSYALAFENRGFSHLDSKDLVRALADFSRAIDLNPRSARALNGRGVANERRGNRDSAISDYRRALDVDQSLSAARQNLTRLGEKP